MEIIDDEGQLLGVINIVDALVVLFALSAVVAGASLASDGAFFGQTEMNSTHVTLDLGTQPAFIVNQLNEGDTSSPRSNSNLTITDIHLTPQGDDTRVVVRAKLEAPASSVEEVIQYNGAPPRLGRNLTIATSNYEVEGQIRAAGEAEALPRATPTVVLRGSISAAAPSPTAGDQIKIADRTVATIDDAAIYATSNANRRLVFVQATLVAHRPQGGARFGGQPLVGGQEITLPGDDYTIAATIESVGGGLERDNTDVLIVDIIDIKTANRLAEGDTSVVARTNVATVEHVQLYGTNNPEQKRAFIGLSLSTVGHGERPTFGETPIQTGQSVTFRAPGYTLSGPIQRVGKLQQRGSQARRTVTLRIGEVREEFASEIDEGMTERVRGKIVAQITDVTIEPTTVLVTGDRGNIGFVNRPDRSDMIITAELQVRETTTGPQFKGQPIRVQDTVTLDLGSITIRGTVTSI
jgi:hypothetical protein